MKKLAAFKAEGYVGVLFAAALLWLLAAEYYPLPVPASLSPALSPSSSGILRLVLLCTCFGVCADLYLDGFIDLVRGKPGRHSLMLLNTVCLTALSIYKTVFIVCSGVSQANPNYYYAVAAVSMLLYYFGTLFEEQTTSPAAFGTAENKDAQENAKNYKQVVLFFLCSAFVLAGSAFIFGFDLSQVAEIFFITAGGVCPSFGYCFSVNSTGSLRLCIIMGLHLSAFACFKILTPRLYLSVMLLVIAIDFLRHKCYNTLTYAIKDR
jgi:cation transport ATPase